MGGDPSKTKEFDETITLDLPRQRLLAQAILRLKSTRAPDEPLFSVSQTEVASAFRAAATGRGLEPLGDAHPYSLRHSGPSRDLGLGVRTGEEAQRRGRWRHPASLRRYAKGGRLPELMARLDEATLLRVTSSTELLDRRLEALALG